MEILLFFYAVVGFAACCMTLVEYRTTGGGRPAMAALGVLACIFWPLTLAVVAIEVRRQQNSGVSSQHHGARSVSATASS